MLASHLRHAISLKPKSVLVQMVTHPLSDIFERCLMTVSKCKNFFLQQSHKRTAHQNTAMVHNNRLPIHPTNTATRRTTPNTIANLPEAIKRIAAQITLRKVKTQTDRRIKRKQSPTNNLNIK